jgi:hypothetical protein
MEKLSLEITNFARTCERLLVESPPPEITEDERSLIEHYTLGLFSRYGKHEEKMRPRWNPIIPGH